MPSTELSRPRRRRARLALVPALVAVGCSGPTGGGPARARRGPLLRDCGGGPGSAFGCDAGWQAIGSARHCAGAPPALDTTTTAISAPTGGTAAAVRGPPPTASAGVITAAAPPGPPLPQTAAALDIHFSTAPDGRLEFNFDDASLASVVAN